MVRIGSIIMILILAYNAHPYAQEVEELHLESFINAETEAGEENVTEDLIMLRENPVNINTAGIDELLSIVLINRIQAERLLSYRRIFGPLISIYELQAVPGWDPDFIRKILPYITLRQSQSVKTNFTSRMKGGKSNVILRYGRTLNFPGNTGNNSGSGYAGSPDKILMRYRYQFRNLLQYGFTAEKDAGEYFRFGNGNFGMDFYSFHLFMRQTVGIEAVALGDFTIQMGQGLIQFQGMAFKKGAEVVQVKRQSPVLKPYTASGEYNFHRGVAVSLKKGSWTSTVFASYRRLSATLNEDAVSGRTISSVNTYGLHRTELEISRKGNLEQWCGGGAAKFHFGAGDIGVNAVAWSFGYPWLKDKFPYQLYAVRGDKWINASVDFSCTYRQVHVFGEFALDPQTDYAVVAGIMMAPDRKMSVGMLYRNISSGFQSLMSNAFTENSTPSNEQGFYTGLSLKPDLKWQIDGYADWFKFPWLKFRVNSPAAGSDYFVNITHKPTRKVEIVLRYRYEAKPLNPSGTKEVVVVPESVISESVRLHIGYQPGKIWELRWRWEQKRLSAGNRYSDGFLWYQDIRFKSPAFRWNLDIRVLYAETDSWDSRLYAYENDVLNAGSISAFSGKGWRLYLNWGYKFSRRFRFWWKVGYSGIGKSDAIETEAPGESKKLDAKIQLQVLW